VDDQDYEDFYRKVFQDTFDKALDHWEKMLTGPGQLSGLTKVQKDSYRHQVAKAREVFLEEFIKLAGKIENNIDCGEYEDDTYHDNSPNNVL
jgi:hypothetical protein